MASNDIGDWYKSIPQLTRYWFSGSVILPLVGKLGLLNPMTMVLIFEKVIYEFNIWRPVTALLYYPITPQTGFHYLINLYFLYSYSTRLESGVFDGRPADYACMLTFNWLCLVIIGFILNLYLLMDPMVLSVLYIWCQLNRDTIVTFWFGMRFKAMYLPWVLVAFKMIVQGGGLSELLGIFVGHLYFFLAFKYPQDFGGATLIRTPEFVYKLFPNRRGGVAGFGVAPASRAQPREEGGPGHRWGGGHRLDD